MKHALVIGATGQDGSYLSEMLLDKGYRVFALKRHTATPSLSNIQHLLGRIEVIPGDLTDQMSLDAAVRATQPDEVYNLGAQSFVKASWDMPEMTADVNGLGSLRVLEAVRKYRPQAKYYFASTSELFGKVAETPQTEATPFHPRSPYGVAKLYGHWIAVNYRESYGMFACCGILYNHESVRRGEHFVTQKIANGAASIAMGQAGELLLGNLDAKRDIGHAADYVEAMWLMLQQDRPDDYVIATGEAHSVREMAEVCFGYVGLDWGKYVRQDPQFMRPAEVDALLGDASKARRVLGWRPRRTFRQIMEEMVEYNLQRIRRSTTQGQPAPTPSARTGSGEAA